MEGKVQRFHLKLLGESITIESITTWLGTLDGDFDHIIHLDTRIISESLPHIIVDING